MPLLAFIKKNCLILIITVLFAIWMAYLGYTWALSSRSIHFYNVLTTGAIEDVSSQYISTIPTARYFIEPLVGLTFILTFNSDPRDTIYLFIFLYLVVRVALLVIDNTLLRHSERKRIFFRYVKDVLEFFVTYGSIIIIVLAAILGIGYFTLGFLFVANYFKTCFHAGAVIGALLLAGRAVYCAVIYYHPKKSLKVKISRPKRAVTKTLVRMRRELFYFWAAFLLLFTVNFTLLSVRFPTQQITAVDLGPNEYLFDFHVHTTMSDGDLTPEQRVMWYIKQGIHGAAITDHHHPRGAQRARAFVERFNLDFVVWIGQEFTDDPEGLHLNVFGIEVELTPEGYTEGPYGENRMNVSEMVQWVKAQGGYVIVNHYYSNSTAPFTYEQLRDWGVDGFEIANGANYDSRYEEIRSFCLNNSLICFSNTDFHLTRELNTFVRLNMTEDPNNLTLDNVFKNLQYNNHQCVIIPEYNYYSGIERGPLDELEVLHNYFLNLDFFQSLSWVLWSVGVYILIIFSIQRMKRVNLDTLRKKIKEKT